MKKAYRKYVMHSLENTKGERASVGAVLDKGVLKFGIAICSKEDQFIKKVGFNKACGRALIESEISNIGTYEKCIYKIEIDEKESINTIFNSTAENILAVNSFACKKRKNK